MTTRDRPFLQWIAVSHVLIAWFVATPNQTVLPDHPLWVIPFIVAATACAYAAIDPTRQRVAFAGASTMVAYCSRALAFPFAAVTGTQVPASAVFGVLIWAVLAAYAWRTFRAG